MLKLKLKLGWDIKGDDAAMVALVNAAQQQTTRASNCLFRSVIPEMIKISPGSFVSVQSTIGGALTIT